MDGMLPVIIIVAAIALIIIFNVLGRVNNLLGKIMRTWWNIGFIIWSYIPFFSWMKIFIIKDPNEKK